MTTETKNFRHLMLPYLYYNVAMSTQIRKQNTFLFVCDMQSLYSCSDTVCHTQCHIRSVCYNLKISQEFSQKHELTLSEGKLSSKKKIIRRTKNVFVSLKWTISFFLISSYFRSFIIHFLSLYLTCISCSIFFHFCEYFLLIYRVCVPLKHLLRVILQLQLN